MKSKILLILFLAAGLVYFAYIRQQRQDVDVGQKAPSFSLPTQQGSLSLEQFRGKVVLLNFWATWCPTCQSEMPSLESFNKQMEGKSFQLLAVSVDEEGWPAVDRFLTHLPLTMTILLDSKGDVASQYGTYQLPESYLIDKNGIIVKKYIGSKEWTDPKIVQEILKYVERP